MRIKLISLFMVLSGLALAQNQNARYDAPFPSITSIGSIPYLVANVPPVSPKLAVCVSPANGVPCTNFAQTYTGSGATCPNASQDTPQPATTSACQAVGDAQGNIGFWAAPGTYDYTVCVGTTCFGPYTVVLVGSGAATVSTSSPVGWQAVAPSSPEVDIPVDPSEACAYNPNILVAGQFKICNPGNGQLWGDPGSGPLLFMLPQIPIGTPANGAVPQYVAANNDYEILPLSSFSVLPPAQVGDIIRFNVNGDNTWDAANAAVTMFGMTPDVSTGSDNFTCWGMFASQCVNDTKSSFSNVNPTGTAMWGRTLTAAASASTSTVIGMHAIENGGNSLVGMVSFNRVSTKIQINNTTNARWWIGMCTWNSGSGTGSNSAQCDGTTAYAANIPNKTTLAFRYVGGTDSHWQCVSIIAGTPLSTVVDTGITPDTTAPHVMELATNAAGTTLYCLIDRVLVGTVTTNIIAPGGTADTWGSPFWTGDNENTATGISATWYSTVISFK